MGRRSRRREADGESGPGDAQPVTRGERTAAKNAAAREQLVPLAEGERPLAVTIAVFVVLLQALLTVGSYIAGLQLAGGGAPPLLPLLAYTFILLITAWGLWKARYWAVLGTQAVLVLLIVVASLYLVVSTDILVSIVIVALIAGAGTLFWFLVKAMARIQMPRPRRR